MLAATVVGLLASPIILPAAAVVDLAKGRVRLPTVRVALFLIQYGINDCVEILLAPLYWMQAGFGTRLHQPTSIARHERLQDWSVDILARRAERLLGLRLAIDRDSAARSPLARSSCCADTSTSSTPRSRRCSTNASGTAHAG